MADNQHEHAGFGSASYNSGAKASAQRESVGEGGREHEQGEVDEATKRGFAGMDPETQRTIASQGGRAAHRQGTAHEFTPDEARVAGRKGGEVVSRNRQHMAEIGRKGGQNSRGGQRRKGTTESEPPESSTQSTAPTAEDDTRDVTFSRPHS